MNGNFNQDLESGKKVEFEICKVIQKKYPLAYVIDGYNKDGDIQVPEKNILVEVKYDVLSEKTDKYFVEIEYGGEPSGLVTTRSDWWVIVDSMYYLWYMPDVLSHVLNESGGFPRLFNGIGDSKAKRGYLVNRDLLRYSPYCHLMNRAIDIV